MNSAQHLSGKTDESDERVFRRASSSPEQMVRKIVEFRAILQGRRQEFETEFNHHLSQMQTYRSKILVAVMDGDTDASENCARAAAHARQNMQAVNTIQVFMAWPVSEPEPPNWEEDFIRG